MNKIMKFNRCIASTMENQAGTMRAGCASPLLIGAHLIQTPGRLSIGGQSI
jgi:hypothetical protein